MRKLCLALTLFVLAVGPATAQMHGGQTIEVPLRVHEGRLVVPVKAANGEEFEFVISTGTPPTVFSASTAARIGDPTGLMMGAVAVNVEEAMTVSDEELTSEGVAIAGMIGPTTLNQYDVLIDVPGGRLVLKSIGRSVSWEGMTMSEPLGLRLYHGMMLSFEVELNGKAHPATLDTALTSLVVNKPVKTAMDLEDEDTGTLRLGNTDLPGLRVRVRDLPFFQNWDPDGNGFVMVGAPIAYDCAISISYVHQELRTCVR